MTKAFTTQALNNNGRQYLREESTYIHSIPYLHLYSNDSQPTVSDWDDANETRYHEKRQDGCIGARDGMRLDAGIKLERRSKDTKNFISSPLIVRYQVF